MKTTIEESTILEKDLKVSPRFKKRKKERKTGDLFAGCKSFRIKSREGKLYV